ncbi:hypothetical protein FB561_0722 [Kribbella amoyensis]|uniref:Uncharacterized protein n=1 Tax=Kribbella amoyensis TaxID=996641 RepID=A0A561BLE6_9ACTN|nr:hypothetical protein [Kribbella amoyensis]TWD79658.1 hypothetical protein FB561_0722 [Kribbella amoyensis]
MNLTDLREELHTRATSTEERPIDLLPAVRRKIRRTKQRRVAALAAGTVAAVALALSLIPGLTTTTEPAPAETPPADLTKDGITLRRTESSDRLEKGWIGDLGQNQLDVAWTPTQPKAAFYVICRSAASSPRSYWVRVNAHKVAEGTCQGAGDWIRTGSYAMADDPLWLDTPVGEQAQVTAQLVDGAGQPLRDATAQLALGIYQVDGRDPAPLPTGPADHIRDGFRFRDRIAGDRLATAVIGDRGQSQVTTSFTATGKPISLRGFCTGNDFGFDPRYDLRISVDGVERISGCSATTTDAGGSGGATLPDVATAGRVVEVTAKLTDRTGRDISVPQARIGVGVYEKGAQRTVDEAAVDEVVEYEGRTYRLQQLRTAPAATARKVTIETPADTEYLLLSGSSALGTDKTVSANVVSEDVETTHTTQGGPDSFGLTNDKRPAAPESTTVRLELVLGKPTRGHLVLAVYLPE